MAEIPPDARHRCNYVTPGQFRDQLRFLRLAGYQSVTFQQYLAFRRGEEVRPVRPIMITFDDGYRSNLDFALPALEAAGFSATVFVVSGLLGRTNAWDNDEVQEPLLSGPELRTVIRRGHEVQSHTKTHPDLTRLSDRRAFEELRDSRRELEQIVGRPVTAVAYPWGLSDHRVRQLALDAGYAAGVILRRRVNFPTTSPLELRRIGVNTETSIARFAWDLARLRFRGE